MKNSEIESWALRTISQAQSQQPSEDSRVELKSIWPPDYSKAARRIAAHLNAARGEPLLWLIGVDEKTGTTLGADRLEFTKWIGGIAGEFDGLAPRCYDVNVPTNNNSTVVALVFESDRAPYVVRNPKFGTSKEPIALEVPWREGTAVRSATRADLLLILSEKRSLRALLGEMEWNASIVKLKGPQQEQFRDDAFHQALGDGSLSDAGSVVKDSVMAAYLKISNAQSHRISLQSTTDSYLRQSFAGQVLRTTAEAEGPLTQAIEKVREILGG